MDEVKLLEGVKVLLALFKREQEDAVESVSVAADLLEMAKGRPDVNRHVVGILDELVAIQRRRIEVVEAAMTQPAIAEALDMIEKCEVIEVGDIEGAQSQAFVDHVMGVGGQASENAAQGDAAADQVS